MNNVGSSRKSADLERLENRKPLCFVFEHDHWFARTWMYVMHFLLLYTAFNIPLNVAFDQSGIAFLARLDQWIDYMFIADVLVNFITGYEDDDNNSEFRLKMIARRYVKSWFWPDVLACLPFDRLSALFLLDDVASPEAPIGGLSEEEIAKKQQLFRLAKLPRLYRLIRIVRLLRLVKMGNNFKRLFAKFRINQGTSKMINVFLSAVFLIHLVACLWFWNADFLSGDAAAASSWIVRKGF